MSDQERSTRTLDPAVSKTRGGPGSKPRVNKEERRRDYIRIASRVFLDRGLHAATMQDVAQAAGAPKVLFYRIFGSKDGLLQAILDEVLATIHDAYRAPNYTYGSRLVLLSQAARQRPEPFLLVLRYSRGAVEQKDWAEALVSTIAKYNRRGWYEPHPDAPPGAAARADKAARHIGFLIDTLRNWIEDTDGLDDAARQIWWSRVSRETHLALREAYQLGPPTAEYPTPRSEVSDGK